MTTKMDLVIQNGRVIDGTGNPPMRADIAIADGKIVHLAQTFGLGSKGLLREGYDADIVIFDPDTIIDRSTFEEPSLPPAGIPWVIVNGQVAVEQAKVAGATSGRVLRREDTCNRF